MTSATGVQDARRLLEAAINRRLFPCSVAEVGSSAGSIWRQASGRLWFDSDPASASDDQVPPAATLGTWFDLASLTKPLATTPLILDFAATGIVDVKELIARRLPEWRRADRASVTITDLLEHASGLPARVPVRPQAQQPRLEADSPAFAPAPRRTFLREICDVPLEYQPRTRSVYSDLGFILLGLLAEQIAGQGFDSLVTRLFERLAATIPSAREIGFAVPVRALPNTAPIDPLPQDPRTGRRLVGEVQDDYAAALGGAAGHAGLFGTAAGVAAMATTVLRAARGESNEGGGFSVEWTRRAISASTVPGSSRALGWDRMLPTSSCGTRMSESAFGHVGFTGTSLWIDPRRDRYYVLLTNRACGGGTLDEMRELRRAFHDALADV